jgi:hypothetical protein
MILLANKQLFPAIASGHHMIHRTRILESQLSCHARMLMACTQRDQAKY